MRLLPSLATKVLMKISDEVAVLRDDDGNRGLQRDLATAFKAIERAWVDGRGTHINRSQDVIDSGPVLLSDGT
jgi:hypothetical protein